MGDIALLGATGFAGVLTAEYLARRLPPDASWQIAGRDPDKLSALAERVTDQTDNRPDVVVCDVDDADSMLRLARGTRVLITTVGPYLAHGEAAVRACAFSGTDYVDLTGEPEFVDRMWLRYHETAKESGARIVHACGFDSVPSDLGVLRTVQKLSPDEGQRMHVSGYIRASAMVSAGTVHSAVGQIARMGESARAARSRREQEARPTDRKVRGVGKIGRGPGGAGWALPLPIIDPQIVLRSARALDTYGTDFTYAHYAWFRRLPVMVATVAGAGVLGVAAQIAPVRKLLKRVLRSGTGPSKQRRDASWFRLRLIGTCAGRTVTTYVSGGDPAYNETAVMLAESAMALAFDDVPPVAGQTTSAVAIGDALITRLADTGITID